MLWYVELYSPWVAELLKAHLPSVKLLAITTQLYSVVMCVAILPKYLRNHVAFVL